MIDISKKRNLYILPNKSSYHTLCKFMRFLSEEQTILYLDFSYDKNKEIGEHYLTYRSMSYEMTQDPKLLKDFIQSNLRNIDIVVIDINGAHNVPIIKEVESIFEKVNLNILCLQKRADRLLQQDFRFDEIYSIEAETVTTLSDESQFTFESFKLKFIRDIKLDKLI